MFTGPQRKEYAGRLNPRSSMSEIFIKTSEPGTLPSGETYTHVNVSRNITFPGMPGFKSEIERIFSNLHIPFTPPPKQHLEAQEDSIGFAFCDGPIGLIPCHYDFSYMLNSIGDIAHCIEACLEEDSKWVSRLHSPKSIDAESFEALIQRGDDFLTIALKGAKAIMPANHPFKRGTGFGGFDLFG